MHVPRELRWIGPLFLITYLILWARRGFSALIAVMVGPFLNPFSVPFIVVAGFILTLIERFHKQYLFPGIVLFLSLFFSGVMLEFIPQPWTGPFPPPPMAIIAFPIVLLTPGQILPLLLSVVYFPVALPTFISLFLLSLLPFVACYVSWLVVCEKMDTVRAMLYFVFILMCWTFLVLPLSLESGLNGILTPIPLGPLAALNLLPWVPARKTQQPESNE